MHDADESHLAKNDGDVDVSSFYSCAYFTNRRVCRIELRGVQNRHFNLELALHVNEPSAHSKVPVV